MKIVSLDVHSESSQVAVIAETGQLIKEAKVPTRRDALRSFIGRVSGPKRVIFEEGPMSGKLKDWLSDCCDDLSSLDPTHNSLVALSETSNDRLDARRLGEQFLKGGARKVYIPDERHRALRSMLNHDYFLHQAIVAAKNRISGLTRRQGLGSGSSVYRPGGREKLLSALSSDGYRAQLSSLYRHLDRLSDERGAFQRAMRDWVKDVAIIKTLMTIPGVGPVAARTLYGWIVDASRFRTANQVAAYVGLGIGQGWTNWKPVKRGRASKRGNRQLKRVLFISAKAAVRTDTALGRRYRSRIAAGWECDKATRDIARTIAICSWKIMATGEEYDDSRIATHANSAQ